MVTPLFLGLVFTYFPIMNNSGKFKEISYKSFHFIIPPSEKQKTLLRNGK